MSIAESVIAAVQLDQAVGYVLSMWSGTHYTPERFAGAMARLRTAQRQAHLTNVITDHQRALYRDEMVKRARAQNIEAEVQAD